MQCSIGCGGQACKYDNPNYWSDNLQAIKGLYSSWYTSTLVVIVQQNPYISISIYSIYPSNFVFFYCFRVSDHLLAMSRPSTEIIDKYNIIDQFKRYRQLLFQGPQTRSTWGDENNEFFMSPVCACVSVSRNGIKTVINLQIPGEHASCGNPLEPESGFSYRPEVFMENNSKCFMQSFLIYLY